MIEYLQDLVLRFIQKRCKHPGNMVATDILEGCGNGIAVSYCRRCGAVKTDWDPFRADGRIAALEHFWRSPDPFLWRGQ